MAQSSTLIGLTQLDTWPHEARARTFEEDKEVLLQICAHILQAGLPSCPIIGSSGQARNLDLQISLTTAQYRIAAMAHYGNGIEDGGGKHRRDS